MQNNISEYQGKKIWSVTVVGLDPEYIGKTYNANKWIFRCECGNTFSASPSRVLSGHKKSCGCKKGKASLTHGMNGDPFYPTWWAMMRRCYHKENHNYGRYGGRGITVCQDWHNPENFILWARKTLGVKDRKYTLDRIDNNKGYCPENCRWISAKGQANNRRSNSLETIDGETKTLSEWCQIYNIKPETVRARQKRGMTFLDALSTPLLSKACPDI